MKNLSKTLLALLFLTLVQSSVAQSYQQQDSQEPEIAVTSPKVSSQHNYFPAISGTAIDKPSIGSNGESVSPSGVAFVKISIVAYDGTIWNGSNWITPRTYEDNFQLSAILTSGQWIINNNLPRELKRSANNPEGKITEYSIGVLAQDNAGNKAYLEGINLWVSPIELLILDANKKFTGVDLSDERKQISLTDLLSSITFLSEPTSQQLQDPQYLSDMLLKRMSSTRHIAVADGATKLLIVGKGYSPGTVTFESSPEIDFADACNQSQSYNFDYSSIPNYPGGVCTTGAVTGDKFTYILKNLPAKDVVSYRKSENEYYWFALYTVPPDINQPNSLMGHVISLTTKFKSLPGRDYVSSSFEETSKIPLFLKRPPVLLVHGLNDNSDSWNLKNNTVLQDAGFDVNLLDYRRTSGASFETNKLILLRNTLGVRNNTTNIEGILKKYRESGIAISKVDVVGHSMGGILARVFYEQLEYRSDDNFKQGYIRRLITIGTPHLGSNIANILTEDVRQYGLKSCGELAFGYAGGEAASVDLSIGSDALLQIGQTLIPSHALYGIAQTDKLSGEYYTRYLAAKPCIILRPIKGMLPLGRYGDDTQADFIKSVCAGEPCDWTVSVISQQGGLKTPFINGFSGVNHSEEIGSIVIREKVRDLLRGGEEDFDPKGFPAVNSVEPQPPTSLDMFPTTRTSANRAVKSFPTQKKSASQDIIKPEIPKPIKSPNSEQQPIANEEQVRIALQSIQISVPDGWQKIQSGKKIAVVPDDGFKNGRITKGLIYGTLPNNGKPLTISQFENELLSMNPNLKTATSEAKGMLAGMEAIGRSYKGFSTVTNTTEEVRIYVINLQNGVSLYILIIAPEMEVTSSTVLNQIVSSLKIK